MSNYCMDLLFKVFTISFTFCQKKFYFTIYYLSISRLKSSCCGLVNAQYVAKQEFKSMIKPHSFVLTVSVSVKNELFRTGNFIPTFLHLTGADGCQFKDAKSFQKPAHSDNIYSEQDRRTRERH